jgi:putative ATP-dependent endonuclease of the OLD family
MRLTSVKIRNLRSIDSLQLDLQSNFASIVRPNSSGKSNVFRGLELFFQGSIDRRSFVAPLDMPKWVMETIAPQVRTQIQVEFSMGEPGDEPVWKFVEEFFNKKRFPVPQTKFFKVVRYFSRSGASGFQCIVPGQGTRSTEGEDLIELVERIRKRVEFRYVPSLKDLQSDSFREISEELKRRLLSIWAGADRRKLAEKRERFKTIRTEIEQLIQDSAAGLSHSLHDHFPDVATIKLAGASTELEDMIGTLDIFADDGHETLMKQKGSGVQGASIIHMLRILRETAPRGRHQKRLFLWNIEEPETFLHPTAQRKLADMLRQQSKNTQILITTHSPIFVQRENPIANVLFKREKQNGYYATQRIKLPTEDPLRPIRESLGTSLADSLSLHELAVIVEGLSDVTVFSKAFDRLCQRGVIKLDRNYCAFVSGHGASQQATGFTILKSWSPLSRAAAIFDYDREGRDNGAKKIKIKVLENKDYFFLPHATDDVVLEDLYSQRIKDMAQTNGAIAQVITIQKRPDGTEISNSVEWNKDQLANYFCENATDPEWQPIENFIKDVITKINV